MAKIDAKHKVAILRVLRRAGRPIGSAVISRRIQEFGIDLSDRTIRLYLEQIEAEGLVTSARRGRRGGRTITLAGAAEIEDALVMHRVGLTAVKVDTLAYQMTFDLKKASGLIVLNTSIIDEKDLGRAVKEMMPVFEARLGMGDYVLLGMPGDKVGHVEVPEGKAVIGTVCSVTINGVLLKAGIPTASRFGGVLEIHEGKPLRFTDVIYYDATSLDPLEVFIKGGLTSVGRAAASGSGRIGASFREVPTPALEDVERLHAAMERIGLHCILMTGKPNQPLLDFPVHDGLTGIIVAGGLNPAAAIEEAGIPTANFALSCLVDFEKLIHYERLSSIVR